MIFLVVLYNNNTIIIIIIIIIIIQYNKKYHFLLFITLNLSKIIVGGAILQIKSITHSMSRNYLIQWWILKSISKQIINKKS